MARSKAKPKRRSRTPDTITAAMLTGACAYQVELFNHHWPNGLRITLATVVTAAHQGFDLSWAAERLLPASALAEYYRVRAAALAEYERVTAAAWAEYERVTAAAWAECERVRAAAWAECERVRAAAWAEYERVTAPAWAEYERVRAPAWAEYERVRAPAWAEYERVRAAALFSAWKRHGLKPLETRWSSVPNRRPGLGAAMDAGPAY